MKVLPWKTPFSEKSFPSILLAPSLETANAVDLIIFPGGDRDQYPAFVVHFDSVPAYRSYYEGMAPNSLPLLSANGTKCAFIIEDSPWKSEFESAIGYIETSFGRPFSELQHFVVLGGDSVVEVLSYNPTFEEINESRLICEIRV